LALVGVEMLLGSGGVADAATHRTEAVTVVRDSVDAGLAGTVGLIAVLVGAVGLVFGLTRHRRKSVAQRAAARAVAATERAVAATERAVAVTTERAVAAAEGTLATPATGPAVGS
jgi:hypothetical protein